MQNTDKEAVTDSRNVASVLKEAMVSLDAGQTILHQTGDINGANVEFNCAFGCLETLKDLLNQETRKGSDAFPKYAEKSINPRFNKCV